MDTENKHTEIVSMLKADGNELGKSMNLFKLGVVFNVIEPARLMADNIDKIKRHVIYNDKRNLLGEPADDPRNINRSIDGEKMDIIHACLGLMGETAELVTPLLQYALSEVGELDMDNALEERGDIEWYNKLLDGVLGLNRRQILQANIDKLQIRYPDMKFTEEHASERLDKEGDE